MNTFWESREERMDNKLSIREAVSFKCPGEARPVRSKLTNFSHHVKGSSLSDPSAMESRDTTWG